MSDPKRTRDAGMTLPEILITTMIFGLIVVVLTAGVSVTMRQQQATQSRVDVSRWEQNLGMWLPDDLSSAATVTALPGDSPCGAPSCPGVGTLEGSSVIQLSWTEDGVTTTVSYRYQPDGDDAYGLYRVACTGGSCTSTRVLGSLSGPVDSLGNPISWQAGDPVPASLIEVDVPQAIDTTSDDPLRRVSVMVSGVPTPDGDARTSRITVSASGAKLDTLEPPTFTPPSFARAYSECGGPITLVVDRSGSIGGDMPAVRDAVKAFVNAFDGTPTQLQIVDFATLSNALGATGTEWNKYYDLSEPGVADDIELLVDGLRANGSTNWEDALFRTLRTRDGRSHAVVRDPSAPMPELVVFFTDGMPTLDRSSTDGRGNRYKSDSAATDLGYALDAKWSRTSSDSPDVAWEYWLGGISPRAWYRASLIASDGGTRIIGVGVGPEFPESRFMWRSKDDRRIISGWPNARVPHSKFLGNLAVGGDPADLTDPEDNEYQVNTWNPMEGWGDVAAADVLVASDFTKAAEALVEIALDTCGGTLTVQTRTAAGVNAPFELVYEMEGSTVSTSRVSKSGTFDVAIGGQPSKTVRLTPTAAQIGAAGYTATGWTCKARGTDLVQGTDFTLVTPGDPAAGIDLTVRANAAVACTLEVTK